MTLGRCHSRVFAENDSNPRPVFGARNSTDAIKLFTRQHNATVYHRLLHETTTLKCELDAVKIRHDQLMTKLDRNKISFKSAVGGLFQGVRCGCGSACQHVCGQHPAAKMAIQSRRNCIHLVEVVCVKESDVENSAQSDPKHQRHHQAIDEGAVVCVLTLRRIAAVITAPVCYVL
jgi:hypothetical protein